MQFTTLIAGLATVAFAAAAAVPESQFVKRESCQDVTQRMVNCQLGCDFVDWRCYTDCSLQGASDYKSCTGSR